MRSEFSCAEFGCVGYPYVFMGFFQEGVEKAVYVGGLWLIGS